MTGDWRVYRPAIWLAMLGVALMLVFNPPYAGALVLGASLGIAGKIYSRRRRMGRAGPGGRRRGR